MLAVSNPPAADVAHEICNLVQAIDGYLELASRRSGDPATQAYLADARRAAEQLIALTRQLAASAG